MKNGIHTKSDVYRREYKVYSYFRSYLCDIAISYNCKLQLKLR